MYKYNEITQREVLKLENEIREVVYIAITAIVLAIVLGLASIVMSISRDMSEVRNNEVYGSNNIQEYREFNKYDRNILNGDEVIECITKFKGSEVEVLVKTGIYDITSFDYIENYDGEEYANEKDSSSDFLRYRQSDIIKNITDKYDLDTLMEVYTTDKMYKSYLIYNSLKPGVKFNDIHMNPDNTGDNLDDLVGINEMANSEVTGILIIRTE